ncbi:glycoside hydrolase family 3 protein [Kibdelosporangium aridum]|uniref:beta-N-acetylhexosaminidase n=1 Tax=Kibdelosporangium aridum TaxID=2030 RepID=A0A428YY06_KIBAR|nr:glycoside hydrolase family 3 protein [Kibdelosporangium aridum]RSM75381.1 glycoside hydrolase family 3 protein [Kibdelosporangium aridum]
MKWILPLLLAVAVLVPAAASTACRTVEQLTPDERLGQLIMVGGDTSRAQEMHAGLVSLPDMPDVRSAAEFTRQQGKDVLVGGDFEHGAIHGIGGTTAYPRPMGLGATRDPAKAAAAALGTATELKQAGVRLNLAPLADVNSNPQFPFGVRSYGEDPGLISRMVTAQVLAYRSAGVVPAVKHFPGHGGVNADPHWELPTVDADRATVDRVHFPPFRAAIAAGAPMIMTAHVVLQAVDPDLPSTLSNKVITGILRSEMDFDGVVITDSIQMGAIKERWGVADASVRALKAGADVVLSTGPHSDHVAIREALRAGLTQERIDQSAARVLRLKCQYRGQGLSARVDPDPIAQASITLLDNRSRALPFNSQARTFVAGVMDVQPLAQAMGASWWQASSDNPTDAEIAEAVRRAEDQVLVATYSRGPTLPEGQTKLVQALKAAGKRVAAVSLGVPYDVNSYPDLGAALAAYAQTQVWGPPPPANMTVLKALAKVVFGAQPGGKLPVTVSARYPYGLGLRY